MTEFIRTECPKCHTQYKVSLAQLASAKPKARVAMRCAQCKTSFVISENLAAKTANPSPTLATEQQPISQQQPINNSANTSPQPKQSRRSKTTKAVTAVLNDDSMIHDNMLIDDNDGDSEDNNDEAMLTSIDSNASHNQALNPKAKAGKKNIDLAIDFGEEWLVSDFGDSDFGAKPTTGFQAVEDEQPLVDESWIADLLAEEQQTEKKQTSANSASNEAAMATSPVAKAATLADKDSASELTGAASRATASSNDSKKAANHPKEAARLAAHTKPAAASLNLSTMTQVFWFFGCIALLLLLVAQYTVFNLDTLIKDPVQQARLQRFCDVVTCALPSADISKIIITNQTYRPSSSVANGTDIIAAISNQSNEAQLFPNILVRIYSGSTLAGEFIATPAEYMVTPQRLIGNTQVSLFMLTVAIDPATITKVQITPFY